MYASSLRIPLIVSWPGGLPEGQVTDHPASIVDIAPTLLSLLGLPSVPSFQGVDLLPRRSLPAQPARTRLFSETHGRVYGVRSAEWRFIFNPERLQPEAAGGPYPLEEVELYDQRSDPREQRNLAPSRPDLVRAFTSEVMAWKLRELNLALPQEPRLDADTREELRALGYIE
jgi:arylsulfatase A-like enzyme